MLICILNKNVITSWSVTIFLFLFFFSSRRRHTRCSRDWSSDVCSSDLELAHTVADEVRRTDVERKGSLAIQIDPLPPAHGDRALLGQVMSNLLQNAAKFTRDRADARVDVGSQRDGGQTVYFVKDNGAGFDARYADKLFGVFQRLHSTEQFDGTGVGLAIVKRIVQRHGGRVWAEGAVNQGATFFFTLPGEER